MGKLFRKWEHGGRAKIGVLPTQLPLSKSRRMPHPPLAPPRHHGRVMEWTAPTNAIYKDGGLASAVPSNSFSGELLNSW